MLTAVLVDDEKHALEALKWELEQHCPGITIAATFDDPMKALAYLGGHSPDILFLDIEMPRLSGFDLLEALEAHPFFVVFTTAYDEFAIKAFKVSAFDYLLKPIDSEELQRTTAKLIELNGKEIGKDHRYPVKKVVSQLDRMVLQNEKIALPFQGLTEYLRVGEILYCESSGNYTRIVLDGEERLVSKTLKFIEDRLPPQLFLRIHHSFLVNVDHVTGYIRGEGGEVVMANKKHLPVARTRKEGLLERLNS